jgi:hypothetical protein
MLSVRHDFVEASSDRSSAESDAVAKGTEFYDAKGLFVDVQCAVAEVEAAAFFSDVYYLTETRKLNVGVWVGEGFSPEPPFPFLSSQKRVRRLRDPQGYCCLLARLTLCCCGFRSFTRSMPRIFSTSFCARGWKRGAANENHQYSEEEGPPDLFSSTKITNRNTRTSQEAQQVSANPGSAFLDLCVKLLVKIFLHGVCT